MTSGYSTQHLQYQAFVLPQTVHPGSSAAIHYVQWVRRQTLHSFDRSELIGWAVELVRGATSDLIFLWSHIDMYSTIDSSEYMSAVLYRFIVDDMGT